MDEKLVRILNSIGKKCFVDYYYDLKEKSSFDVLPIEYTINSKKSRQSHANWIFENKLQLNALVICLKANIDQSTKDNALNILEKETKLN